MLHVICSEKQRSVQVKRHLSNALLAALRRGRVFERPGTPWRGSAKAPNAPVNLPFSPVVEELRKTARSLDRLDRREARDGELSSEDRARRSLLLRQREELAQEARDAIEKEPAWPYVAGLYAVRVPALRLTVDGETEELEPFTVFRVVTVEDYQPIWPALSRVLAREPRNTLLPAPPYAIKAVQGQRTYQRKSICPALAGWLLAQVDELDLSNVGLNPGDYRGQKEAPPSVEAQAAD